MSVSEREGVRDVGKHDCLNTCTHTHTCIHVNVSVHVNIILKDIVDRFRTAIVIADLSRELL